MGAAWPRLSPAHKRTSLRLDCRLGCVPEVGSAGNCSSGLQCLFALLSLYTNELMPNETSLEQHRTSIPNIVLIECWEWVMKLLNIR